MRSYVLYLIREVTETQRDELAQCNQAAGLLTFNHLAIPPPFPILSPLPCLSSDVPTWISQPASVHLYPPPINVRHSDSSLSPTSSFPPYSHGFLHFLASPSLSLHWLTGLSYLWWQH